MLDDRIPKKYKFHCIMGSRSISEFSSPLYPGWLLSYEYGTGWFMSKLDSNGRRLSGMVIVCNNPISAIKTLNQ